jgi:4-aminobutyrate aminotransferase-like enzyme
VGGVRRVPDELLNFLEASRERHGYVLLVDEVQTGMYRTGPFTRSSGLGLTPDLLVTGKGISDMMFPFALVLYSDQIRTRLEQLGSTLPAELRSKHGYDWGFRTALNVLRRAEALNLKRRVLDAGLQVKRLLSEGLADCRAVREVRVYGLLIGIELDTRGWPKRRLRKRLFWFYLSNMLRHRRFPVLVGFCQYEPHVLKITPPLNATDAELRQMCTTVIDVLRRPFLRLAATVAGSMALSMMYRRHN